MTFEVVWLDKALKELEDLDAAVARRIIKKARELSSEPFSKDVKRLRGTPYFRVRIGDYRAIFSADAGVITILKVAHRKEIYKRA